MTMTHHPFHRLQPTATALALCLVLLGSAALAQGAGKAAVKPGEPVTLNFTDDLLSLRIVSVDPSTAQASLSRGDVRSERPLCSRLLSLPGRRKTLSIGDGRIKSVGCPSTLLIKGSACFCIQSSVGTTKPGGEIVRRRPRIPFQPSNRASGILACASVGSSSRSSNFAKCLVAAA